MPDVWNSNDNLGINPDFDGYVKESQVYLRDELYTKTEVDGFNTLRVLQSVFDNAISILTLGKLGKTEKRTGLGANKVLATDESGNEVEIIKGDGNQYVKSDFTFGNPPLDINGQTTDNSDITASDFIAWFKNGVGVRKRIAQASESIFGLVKKASDAEVVTGTNTDKYTTPAQLESTRKVAILQDTRLVSDATGPQIIAHGLGIVPKWIEITAFIYSANSHMNMKGYSDGILNKCSGTNYNYATTGLYSFNNVSNVIYLFIDQSSGAGNWLTRATVTFDATNITLNWVTTGTSNPGGTIDFIILAHS